MSIKLMGLLLIIVVLAFIVHASHVFTHHIKLIDVSGKSGYGYILGRNRSEFEDSVLVQISHLSGYVVFTIRQYDGGNFYQYSHSIPYVNGPIRFSLHQEAEQHVLNLDGDIINLPREKNKKVYWLNKLINETRD